MVDKKDTKIEFGTFVEPEKVNPYNDVIPALIEQGENASVTITVDAKKAGRERLAFGKAANEHGKTARLRLTDDSKAEYGENDKGKRVATGGTVSMTFTLTDRHKARRGSDSAE